MENRLSAARLREIVRYEPQTGSFVALVQRPGRSPPVGSVVGTPNSAGYMRIMVDGVSYLSHRLAWLYMTGEWPTEEVDHINGDHSDNRFTNLREASRSQNCSNTRRPRHNTTGIKGVSKRGERWIATIGAKGRQRYLGTYATADDAAKAYADAAHELHGAYARLA